MRLSATPPRPPRHVALIVEDDPHVARVMKDFVTSLDHDWIHAVTLADVRAAVAAGGYCYVLLDMQIPADDQSGASVGCGETALVLLRQASPRRNALGRHLLQIVVVTAYSRDPDFVSKLHQMDADAFIAKPFGDRVDLVLDKIRAALKRAEREDHAACAAASVAASAPLRSPLVAPATRLVPAATVVSLAIDGSRQKRKTNVIACGRACELQDARFAVFLQFVAAHLRSPGAWSSAAKLGMARNKWMPTRIRAAFNGALPEGFTLIEGDRAGSFRLHPDIVVDRVDWEALREHPEASVRKLASERCG